PILYFFLFFLLISFATTHAFYSLEFSFLLQPRSRKTFIFSTGSQIMGLVAETFATTHTCRLGQAQ
ncbi:hypothetical protein C5167_051185, partial [Papaver somniferum]